MLLHRAVIWQRSDGSMYILRVGMENCYTIAAVSDRVIAAQPLAAASAAITAAAVAAAAAAAVAATATAAAAAAAVAATATAAAPPLAAATHAAALAAVPPVPGRLFLLHQALKHV
eukprot:1158992-Pelagomonas_calceolata.AAC.4